MLLLTWLLLQIGAPAAVPPGQIGARVALGAALGSPQQIAGVIASSAGYPDGQFRKTLPFPIFATAGTEDFNHLEMRRLDAALTTPHHLAIFEGGHTWLSPDLAVE